MRWHQWRVVAQSSHVTHYLEGHSISEAARPDTTEVLAMGWIVTGLVQGVQSGVVRTDLCSQWGLKQGRLV